MAQNSSTRCPPASKERVGIAEYRVTRAPAVLVAYGLGSCLGIILYDRRLQIGGLGHTLLPAAEAGEEDRDGAKYAATAVRLMVAQMVRLGASPQRLEARLAGGASMFGQPTEDGIGARNVRAARAALAKQGIVPVAEDVGGTCGRTVTFDLNTGLVRVRTVRGGEKITIL